MRRFLSLLILPVLAMPAMAEGPATLAKAAPHAARQTWEQHFAKANQAHDGHLTPQEAKSGYPLISKHFDDIDIEHKGYVTEDDIRAWRIISKAARKSNKPAPDPLKPQHAFQPHLLNFAPAVPPRTVAMIGDFLSIGDAAPPQP